MSLSPSVSVIVVNYNTPLLTAELLDSLQEHSADSIHEFLIIDNNSSTDLRYLPEEPNSRLRVWQLNHNLGFGKAVNFAAAQADGDYLLLANSDCLVREDILAAMVEFMQQNPNAGICAPGVRYPDGRPQDSARELPTFANIRASRRSLWRKRKAGYTLVTTEKRQQVPALAASFVLVRRELFNALGGFDPAYVMYVEDTDLCRRIVESGSQVYYLGDLAVYHHWGASSRRPLWRLALEHHRSMRHYFRKTSPDQSIALLWLDFQLAVNLIATLALRFVFRGKV